MRFSHRRCALLPIRASPLVARLRLANRWPQLARLANREAALHDRRSAQPITVGTEDPAFLLQNGGHSSRCGSSRGRPAAEPDGGSPRPGGQRSPRGRADPSRRAGPATGRAAVSRTLGALPRRPRGAAAPGCARLHRGQLRAAQRGRGAGHRDSAG